MKTVVGRGDVQQASFNDGVAGVGSVAACITRHHLYASVSPVIDKFTRTWFVSVVEFVFGSDNETTGVAGAAVSRTIEVEVTFAFTLFALSATQMYTVFVPSPLERVNDEGRDVDQPFDDPAPPTHVSDPVVGRVDCDSDKHQRTVPVGDVIDVPTTRSFVTDVDDSELVRTRIGSVGGVVE